jgi:uncharacterized protein
MEDIVHQTREYVLTHVKVGGVHGIDHWDRVYENGQELVTPKVKPLVVGLFAYLHDSCRVNDGEDVGHGPRAAEFISTLRDNLLKDVSDGDIQLLRTACRLHTGTVSTGNPTIDACFDADRLDLWRVGVIPDPTRMATEKGKEIARKTFYQ